MTDFQREKRVLSQIAKSRQAIRKMYMLLKHGKEAAEKLFNETFKPIVGPLEKLVTLAKPETFKDKSRKNDPDYDLFSSSSKFVTSFKTAIASSEINFNNKKADIVEEVYFCYYYLLKLFNLLNLKNFNFKGAVFS